MRSLEFPTAQIGQALAQSEEIKTLEFSVYDSRDLACGRRRIFRVEKSALRDWWTTTTKTLAPHEEVGLNSRVQLDGLTRHLPMVDTKGSEHQGLDELSDFLCRECPEVRSVSWFTSGRSFHGYGSGLLDDERWRYFMGTLLLFRSRESALTVDTRWVGHRLRDGYACLRLTRNTSAYVERPLPLAKQDTSTRRAAVA